MSVSKFWFLCFLPFHCFMSPLNFSLFCSETSPPPSACLLGQSWASAAHWSGRSSSFLPTFPFTAFFWHLFLVRQPTFFFFFLPLLFVTCFAFCHPVCFSGLSGLIWTNYVRTEYSDHSTFGPLNPNSHLKGDCWLKCHSLEANRSSCCLLRN